MSAASKESVAASALVAALVVASGCHAPPAASPPRALRLAPPRVIAGAPDVTKLLGDAAVRATDLGAGPVSVVASGLVSEGERLGAFVEVPDDACLLVYGRAASAVEDIDLVALTDDGSPLALDESPDPRPTVLLCPPHPRRFYVALQVAQGDGLAVIAAHTVPRALAGRVGVGMGARGALGAPKRADDWPYLDDLLRDHRRALGGAWEETKRVAVPVDTRAPAYVAVSGGPRECLDLLLVPDDDVGLVDAELSDEEGRQIARARGAAEARSLVVCTDAPLAGSLRLRSHVGQGSVAVVMSRASSEFAKEARTRPEFTHHGVALPLPDALAKRATALAQAGYAPASSSRRGELPAARISSVFETLKTECARVDLVVGAPVRRAQLDVWTAGATGGDLLGAAEGPAGAAVFVCPGAKSRVRFDLESRGAGGPFALEVRPALWSGPELTAAPLAASRMLARAASGEHQLIEGTAVGLRRLTLDAVHLATLTEDVPAGGCLHAYLGIEGPGQGVELRLFDAVGGAELDRAHGESSGGVSACAKGAPLKVRLEARAGQGVATAIVGLRR
ncbi:MAG: hypothetical protein IPQ09_06740 [Myxococcales bacterium]|nr:hypothetical protein [Myxococcales bacterium]